MRKRKTIPQQHNKAKQHTAKELRWRVSSLVNQTNFRLKGFDIEQAPLQTSKYINELKRILGTKEVKGEEFLKKGTGLRKNDLWNVANLLNNFLQNFTKQGIKDIEEKERKSFETFRANHPTVFNFEESYEEQYEEYKKIIYSMRPLQEVLGHTYGSNQINEMYTDARGKGLSTEELIDMMKDTFEDYSLGNITPEDVRDIFNQRLGIEPHE